MLGLSGFLLNDFILCGWLFRDEAQHICSKCSGNELQLGGQAPPSAHAAALQLHGLMLKLLLLSHRSSKAAVATIRAVEDAAGEPPPLASVTSLECRVCQL